MHRRQTLADLQYCRFGDGPSVSHRLSPPEHRHHFLVGHRTVAVRIGGREVGAVRHRRRGVLVLRQRAVAVRVEPVEGLAEAAAGLRSAVRPGFLACGLIAGRASTPAAETPAPTHTEADKASPRLPIFMLRNLHADRTERG